MLGGNDDWIPHDYDVCCTGTLYVGHLILLLFILVWRKNGRSKSGARQFYLLYTGRGTHTHSTLVRTVHKYSIYRYVTKY